MKKGSPYLPKNFQHFNLASSNCELHVSYLDRIGIFILDTDKHRFSGFYLCSSVSICVLFNLYPRGVTMRPSKQKVERFPTITVVAMSIS